MTTPETVVRDFFDVVRSGRHPEKTVDYMAEKVLAHQVNIEQPVTIERTPQDYADHIREMLATYGQFTVKITEFMSQGEKVYVRWEQVGTHQGHIAGYPTTNYPLVELASAVYRVADGKIAEYWIQIDRAGLQAQLEANTIAFNAEKRLDKPSRTQDLL